MDAEQVLEHAIAQLKIEEEALKESVADGNAESYAEYKFFAGQVAGLVKAQRMLKDLRDRVVSL